MSLREADEEVCPACGMEKKYWSENRGAGYAAELRVYCCEGCAEGTVCTCQDSPESDVIARIEKDLGRNRRGRRR